MSTFENSFLEKLNSLNGTQVSIQSLSAWLIENKAHVKYVGKIWYKELKKVHRKRKLVLLYLMNDVVQNSRKQGQEFMKVFSSVLTHAVKDCAKAADSKISASLDRLLGIWRQRKVFEPALLDRCEQLVRKTSRHPRHQQQQQQQQQQRQQRKATASTGTGGPEDDEESLSGPEGSPSVRDAGVGSDEDDDDELAEGEAAVAAAVGDEEGARGLESPSDDILGRVASSDNLEARKSDAAVSALKKELAAKIEADRAHVPDAEQILAELQFLLQAPSGSAEMRRKISRFPKHIVEESSVDQCRSRRDCLKLLKEVELADRICSDYNQQLNSEVERRRSFHTRLKQFCQLQRDLSLLSDQRLHDYRQRLQQYQTVRQELSAHLSNLPDLSTLPDVSAGLAPLPSVTDLFS